MFCLRAGDPSSFVMGHIIHGQFDGSFCVFGETFYLEPAQRHPDVGTHKSHSIIFPASSIEFDFSSIDWKTAHVNSLNYSLIYQASFVLDRLYLSFHHRLTN